MNNQIILYHCKQISDGQTVREFQVVADSIETARTACVSILGEVNSPTDRWGIEVYPLSQIACVLVEPVAVRMRRMNPACLPAWGAK